MSHHVRKSGAVLLCLLLGFLAVHAQSNTATDTLLTSANQLLAARKWTEAASAYEELLKREAGNSEAWYQLATARYQLKQYDAAATALLKAIEISNSGFAMYNLACVYSLMGEKDKAIEWLTKTVDNPRMVLRAINFADEDFTNIREDPRFKSLAVNVDRNINPCMYSDEAKQFNFWLGEWDAFNPQGRRMGSSTIQSIANGCGVLENWSGTLGETGKSINFYDSKAGKWFQYWIGTDGGGLRYSGIYRDNAMRYEGERVGPNGGKTITRLTFFNVDANTVRQLSEFSTDDGKTWATSYDLKYVRRAATNR